MNETEQDLRIKEGTKVDGIVEIFERESPIVQMVYTLKSYTKILIIIGIIYILIEFLIPRHTLIGVIANVIFVGLMVASLYIVTGELSYTYSKKAGGKRAKFIMKKGEGITGTVNYNLKIMQREEWRLTNKILRVNHLDSNEAIKDLYEYFGKPKKKRKYEINILLKNLIGIYLLIIVLAIFSIYTVISNNINLDMLQMDMVYLIAIGIITAVILVAFAIVHLYKKFSITNVYTYPKLEQLLLEILLNKEKTPVVLNKREVQKNEK